MFQSHSASFLSRLAFFLFFYFEMSEPGSPVGSWSTNQDPSSSLAFSLGDLEVTKRPTFSPFGISLVLEHEDLSIYRLKYQIPSQFSLEFSGPKDSDPLSGRIGIHE